MNRWPAAEERARDIARVVAETAGAGSAAISRQFEAVRASAEEERRLTAEALNELYQQSTQEIGCDVQAVAADRFATMVAEHEGNGFGNCITSGSSPPPTSFAAGVLEMPQESAENTSQMRKVDCRPRSRRWPN